jgi:hypothetical protein
VARNKRQPWEAGEMAGPQPERQGMPHITTAGIFTRKLYASRTLLRPCGWVLSG